MGEADKLMTLFTKGKGKIKAVAKGARRTTSKFGGRLEPFCYNHMMLASAKTLDIISQVETLESFYRIRETREKLNAGFYMLGLIDIMTEERQENDALFDLLLAALRSLDSKQDTELIARAFEVNICEAEGLMPSDKMLSSKYAKLPRIVEKLRGGILKQDASISEKDLEVCGKVFRMIISDHVNRDIRGLRKFI